MMIPIDKIIIANAKRRTCYHNVNLLKIVLYKTTTSMTPKAQQLNVE
jgi:hypothetical protein